MGGRGPLKAPLPAPLALEQRVMFDGAAIADATAVISAPDATAPAGDADGGSELLAAAASREAGVVPAPVLLNFADTSTAPLRSAQLAEERIAGFLRQVDPQRLLQIFPGASSGEPGADQLARARELIDAILSGEIRIDVRLLDNETMHGAMGAFAANGTDGRSCIYLNRQWVELFATDAEVAQVITEEFGHALDAMLNAGSDTAGDEGQRFGMLAEGKAISDVSSIALDVEDDHSTLVVDGVAVDVELAEVAVPFSDGFIGRQGTSTNATTNIVTFATLGIKSATVFQESTTGQFGGTQGNDYAVGIRFLFNDGRVITVNGAVNWRESSGSTTVLIGIIPAAGTNVSFTYSGGTYTIDANSNFGLEVVGVTYNGYADGGSLSGNAATATAMDSMNTYLATVQSNDPVGPVTVTSLTTSDTTPTISGTATLAAGETLSVMVNGVSYTTSSGLQVSGTSWSLTVPDAKALAAGTYSVVATITNSSGYTLTDTTSSELVISASDTTPPSITGPSGSAGSATSSKTINENTTAVTTLTANETVTWSLNGGEDAAKFAIDSSTGALRFLSAPNYESPTDGATSGANTYIVQVKATDASGNISLQTVTVTVADVDEVAPSMTGPSGGAGSATSSKTINEGTTAVTTLTANETVTWSLNGGEDSAKFAIDSSTGALRFLSAPDYETPTDGATSGANTYIVQVKATDASGNISLQTVTVTVADVDEVAPSITGPSGSAGSATSSKTINEGTTAVTTLTANETVTWSLNGGEDSAKFAIDSNTGALRFLTAPDYEAPTDGATSGANTYIVQVKATDAAGNISLQTVTVTVADVDEVAPSITGPSGSAGSATSSKTINEGTTAVTTLTANETVTWSLNGGEDSAKFAIDSNTGALRFLTAPDYEAPTDGATSGANTYIVQVKATDAAGNISLQTVTVTVADVDEVAPSITGPSGGAGSATSSKTINEGTTAVTTLTANETVTWSLDGGEDAAKFEIDPDTGVIKFISAPDFEAPTDGTASGSNTYFVQVKATDAAGNSSVQTITVTVVDVDDTPAKIKGPSGNAGDESSSKTVDENTSEVATLTASESVTWSLGGGEDAAKFEIDPDTGVIKFISAPDFEAPTDGTTSGSNTYIVRVKATDAAGNESWQTITVTVADVDDAAPQIKGPSGNAGDETSSKTVDENTTAVATLTASESVTWSLGGSEDAAKFEIDPDTGVLKFITAPDFEAPTDGTTSGSNTYIVRVRATDAAGNESWQTITVTVANVDDTGPQVKGPSGSVSDETSSKTIDENTTEVATLTADEPVTWALVGGQDVGQFEIDPDTGELSFIAAPDFEAPTDGTTSGSNTYIVQVKATDAAGNSSVQTITVSVADVDDTPAKIKGPSGEAGDETSSRTIDENTTAVGTLISSEAVTWSLDGGEDAAKFEIDPDTGVLKFITAPDFEAPTDGTTTGSNTYIVRVKASDAAGNESWQTITVTVADVDDTPATITGPSGNAGDEIDSKTINEGTTAVFTLTASETVTWSLDGGEDAAKFEIDPDTGALKFITAPDFEAPTDGTTTGSNTYIVRVKASDAAGNESWQTITVTVADADDAAPQIQGPSGEAGDETGNKTVDENTTTVATLTADEDVTWSLGGGEDAAKFEIDPDTGVLKFVAAPDFEAPRDGTTSGHNTYIVKVKATDAAGNESWQMITVTVADVVEPGPSVVPVIVDVTETATDPTPSDLLTLDDTPTVRITAEPGVQEIRLYLRNPETGEFELVPNEGLFVLDTSESGESVYTLVFSQALQHGDYAVQTWKDGFGSELSGPMTIDSIPGLFDQTVLRRVDASSGDVVTFGHLGGMSQDRMPLRWDAGTSNWVDADGETIRFCFVVPARASVDDPQANADARLFGAPPPGSIITCTLASGSTLLLDTQTGAYTYRPADGATLDAFVVASSDGRQGSRLILTFDARDPLDRDGINANVENVLASLVSGGLGDLNGDGIADANQNAVATLAWSTADRFASAVADPGAFAARASNLASVISLWIALPDDNNAVDDSAQLTGVKVLDPDMLAGGKPEGARWDPIQFAIEPLQSMGLLDSDQARDGLQVTIRIDVSRSGVAEGEFTRYMKYVSAEALQQYADSGLSLRDLDGNLISAAGWYDYTQRAPGGDGAQYVYENGMLQAIVITLTDNSFGDNDARTGYLKDPGVPVGRADRGGSLPPIDPPPVDPPPVDPPPGGIDTGPGPVPVTPPPLPPGAALSPLPPGRPDAGLPAAPSPVFGGVSPFGTPLSSLFGDPAPGRNAAVDGLYRWAADNADIDGDTDAGERLAVDFDAAAEPGGLPAWMANFDSYTEQDDWHAAVIPAEVPSLLVFRGMPDQFVEGGRDGSFTVPWDAFVHTERGAQVLLQATLANGGKLPDWLRFDARSGVFVAVPAPDFRGELPIRLTAQDQQGREASVLFRFRVGDALRGTPERIAGEPASSQKSGRPGLGDKLRAARG